MMPCLLAAAMLMSAEPAPDDTLPVPATILAEGVPDVPMALAQSLRRYQNIRAATFQDWSRPGPGGADNEPRHPLLIGTRFAETTQVHRVAFPGAARYQLTFHPERVVAARQRPGRDQFLYAADEGGAENDQLFLQGRDGTPRRLTDGRSRNIAPRWSPSGRLLAFSGNARNGRDMDLYVLDPDRDAPPRRFKDVSGNWTVADWSPDEAKVVAIEYISINESYVHIIDIESGKIETLTPRRSGPDTPPVAYASVRWAKDSTLYWTTDKDAEFLRLARRDPTTGEETVLTAQIPWDIEEFDVADDGRTVALLANEGGISRLHVLDGRTGEERPAPQLPLGVIDGLRFRHDSLELGFTVSGARAASDVYSFDLESWSLARWTTSETAGFDAEAFVEPERIEFPSFDGRMMPAFVYRPPAGRFPGKRPVVIDIHGGPESQFRPSFLGRDNYLINELGLVLMFPNVRGSSGYGKSYVTLDNGFKREDSVKDIGALLDWIAGQEDLDAGRVGVAGGSYGGFMSLAVQIAYNDRIRAGIDVVGISNFVTFLTNTQDYRRDLRRAEYGDERDPAMRAFLERISPLGRASAIKTPTLIVQGRNDPRVPASEAEQIVAAVRKNGVPVWYVEGTNEGHGFAKRPNQDYLQAVEVLFWRRFLLGDTE